MASDSQKTELLFKEFTGVANTNHSGTFAQEEFAFQDFIFSDGVLTNEIPVDLSNITLNGVYGVAALDASFAQNGASYGDTYAIPNTDLVFYYKRLLQKAYANSNRSWYVPDASDSTISDLKGTIPFKYDANYDSYRQNLWNNSGTSVQGLYNTPLYWIMDYKSGFVEFYGEESAVNSWVTSYGPPRLSYIRYEGPRGVDSGNIIPEEFALKESTVFSLDSGFADGDWLTIAQAGDGTDRNSLRAEGLFVINERSGSHHHCIVVRVGAKFSSGFYLNVESSDWFSSPRILQARIMYSATYDGSVFQLKLKNTGSGNFYIDLYQNTNQQGWNIVADSSGLTAANNPTVYVTDNPSTPTGTAYVNSIETGPLDWDPSGRNSMSTTTKDMSFWNGTVDVSGGTLTVNNANETINDGFLNINGVNQVSGIDMDGTGTAATGTSFNQKEGTGFDVECNYGDANITALDFNILANGTSTNNQGLGEIKARVLTAESTGGDININAQDDVFIKSGTAWDQTQNGVTPSSNGDIGMYAGRHMYLQAAYTASGNTASTMSTTEANINIGSSVNTRWIEAFEPLKVLDNTATAINTAFTNVHNDLQTGTRTANGILAFCRDSTIDNGLICRVRDRNLNISSPPQIMEFMCATKARTHTSSTNQTISGTTTVRWHFSTKCSTSFAALTLSDYGTTIVATYQRSPFPLLVQGYTIHPFLTYANNPEVYVSSGVTGSTDVSFEIWVASTTSSYHSDSLSNTTWLNSSYISNAPNDGIRNDVETETSTQICKKIVANVRTVTHSSSLYNPWSSSSNTGNVNPVSVKLTTPFVIPEDVNFNVYFVERLLSPNGSFPTVNFLGTSSLGYAHLATAQQDASPVGLDLWYTALNEI